MCDRCFSVCACVLGVCPWSCAPTFSFVFGADKLRRMEKVGPVLFTETTPTSVTQHSPLQRKQEVMQYKLCSRLCAKSFSFMSEN